MFSAFPQHHKLKRFHFPTHKAIILTVEEIVDDDDDVFCVVTIEKGTPYTLLIASLELLTVQPLHSIHFHDIEILLFFYCVHIFRSENKKEKKANLREQNCVHIHK
jgi:hypothetical protein